MSEARLLYDIFFEGCTHYSKATIDSEGKVAYHPFKGIPSLDLIQKHIDGLVVLGAYAVLPGNMVRWMAFDIDCKDDPEQAKEIATKLCRALDADKYILEFSGNKGYHAILIFSDPTLAKDAKEIGEGIRDYLGFAKKGDCHVEVFPKQKELKEGELGNLLRLPLGKHPLTQNNAIFVSIDDWDTPLDPKNELETKRVTLEHLKSVIKNEDPKEQVCRILLPYWNDGQRHDISLCTAGYMANLGWSEEDTTDLIKLIFESGGRGTLSDQLKTVKTTFKRYYDGESVLGYSGLADILSSKSLADLTDWASRQTSSSIMQVIDRFRLEKDAAFKKVRKSAAAVISYLKENGKLVTDGQSTYWLDRRIREVIMLNGALWERFSHNEFGLNTAESFGRQTTESIKHLSADAATKVLVHKRYWRDKETGKYYLNLGRQEVYVFDGTPDSPRVIMNGDEDVLFLNTEDTLSLPNLVEDEESSVLDPWDYLTDHLNYKIGDEVQATPIQQRELLKAFIVACLFGDVLATRPILAILALTASGKTTVLRKILRFLEGPDQEVLGAVPDKPDSFRASLDKHNFLALDNLEKTNAPWLPDNLNRVSTGTHIEMRKLHTTNEMQKIRPSVFVGLTATEMPFSDETVYTRILPIELAQLTEFNSEIETQAFLTDNIGGLWKGMFRCINEVVAALAEEKEIEMPSMTRLADFSIFCSRIKDVSFINGKELMAGLENLVNRQKKVLEENSPLVDVINIWVEARAEEEDKFYTISQLFSFWQRIAAVKRLDWRFKSAQGLAKHVEMLKPQLVQHYGMSERSFREGNREILKFKFEKKQMRVH